MGFTINQLAGQAAGINVSIPFNKELKPFSMEGFGDWIYGQGNFPGENSFAAGLNTGIRAGYFYYWSFTILAPIPSPDFWCRPGRR